MQDIKMKKQVKHRRTEHKVQKNIVLKSMSNGKFWKEKNKTRTAGLMKTIFQKKKMKEIKQKEQDEIMVVEKMEAMK